LPENNTKKVEITSSATKISWRQPTNESVDTNEYMTANSESQIIQSSKPTAAGPKINYSKDELAKYDDLSKMSQLYAKINQVGVLNFGPNGITEINMVELDQSQTVLMNQSNNMDSIRQQLALESQNNYNLIELKQDINFEFQQQQHQQQQQLQHNEQIENMTQFLQSNIQSISDQQQQQQSQQDANLSTHEQNNMEIMEQAIQIQMNELEGLTAPKDVTILSTSQKSPNLQSNTSPKPTTSPQLNTTTNNNTTTPLQGATNFQPATTSQTVLLQPQNRLQYQAIQPLQFLSLQNPNSHLIQYAAATNPTPVQQLINLQQIRLGNHHQYIPDGFSLSHLNPSASFITTPSSQLISSHQLAAFQQQQQQQTQLEALINQQNQSLPIQTFSPAFQYLPTLQTAASHHPTQFIIRPGAFQSSLIAPQQPQFVINSPFYRILPQ
jgi:hypothetical protein